MKSEDALYAFVYKGLLTEAALDRTDRIKKSKLGTNEIDNLKKTLNIDDLDDELVCIATKMSVVYTAICAFENMVRQFVSKKLLETKGEKWWDLCVPQKIRIKAASRREEENKIRWHTPRGDTIINYTEFGDLLSIMRIPENWEYFEPHVSSIEWVDNIIRTLERSRNVIMHSGELTSHDIERIGMLIRDWIRQVG